MKQKQIRDILREITVQGGNFTLLHWPRAQPELRCSQGGYAESPWAVSVALGAGLLEHLCEVYKD